MQAAGLGLDVAGAILLAWGLIAEGDRDIVRRTVPMTGTLESSAPHIARAKRSRLAARIGAVLLGIGFALQFVAVVL